MKNPDPITDYSSSEFSECHQGEVALRLECDKLRAVIDNLSVGIGITDAEGTTLSLNEEGLRIHGFSSEAEMFDGLEHYVSEFELRYPDDRLMPIPEWPASRARRGEYVRDYEVILSRPGVQEPRFISYSVVPIYDNQGRLALLVYNMVDLTERKRAEDALRKSHAELELQVQERSRELKKLVAELALLKDDAFEELLKALETVRTGATYLTSRDDSSTLQELSAGGKPRELTPREAEVLKLLASGESTRQIAKFLCISVKTVETHRSNIMKKLNLQNLADLTRYAIRTGLVDL